MTDVLARPSERAPGEPAGGQSRPAVVGALLAAGWAALAGALPCAAAAVVGWFATTGGTAPWALRVGADAWLLAHGVPIDLAAGRLALVPLGLSLLPVILLCRAGAWVGRTCAVAKVGHVVAGAVVLAGAYAGFAALVAVLARTPGASPDLTRALAHAGGLALLAGLAGILRTSGHGRGGWRALPEEVRAAVHGGFAALVGMLTLGLLLVAASLVAHASRLTDLAAGLGPGVVGLVLLAVACLAYLPNAAVFAATYALGPGFALGTGTVVAPTGVVLGPLPAFPLLAAVPVGSTPPVWSMAVLALPIAAGVVAGLAAVRRFPAYGMDAAALRGGLAGVAGGVVFTGLAALAGGSAGPGRLADVGPSLLPVGVVAVSTLGIAGAVGVLATYAWRWARGNRPVRAAGE